MGESVTITTAALEALDALRVAVERSTFNQNGKLSGRERIALSQARDVLELPPICRCCGQVRKTAD